MGGVSPPKMSGQLFGGLDWSACLMCLMCLRTQPFKGGGGGDGACTLTIDQAEASVSREK